VDELFGSGHVPASSTIDVNAFKRFFAEKVEKVRSSTKDAPLPTFSAVQPIVSFTAYQALTCDDVISAVYPTSHQPPIQCR